MAVSLWGTCVAGQRQSSPLTWVDIQVDKVSVDGAKPLVQVPTLHPEPYRGTSLL